MHRAHAPPVASLKYTFTRSSWNTTQSIKVRAVDDSQREGNHSGLVNVTVASSDDRFNGIGVDPIEIWIEDDDCDVLVGPRH